MSNYKFSKALPVLFFLIAVGLFFWYQEANATYKKPPPKPQTVQEQSQDQHQKQGQDQNQHQTSEANAHSDSVAQSDAAANNEGNSLSVESNYESGPAEVVLVPHNNTANCQRVYGLGGGNTSGNVVLGIPFRDRACDLEAAADDAFAQGNTALGWVFKCKQKNIKREFGGKEWRSQGEQLCLEQVASIVNLNDRIRILEEQKTTLLNLRQTENAQCEDAKTRIVEGCTRK